MDHKKSERKTKSRIGREALAGGSAEAKGHSVPLTGKHLSGLMRPAMQELQLPIRETVVILDKKLLRLSALIQKDLVAAIRILRDHIEDQARRIADLEAERDAIGRMAQRLSRQEVE